MQNSTRGETATGEVTATVSRHWDKWLLAAISIALTLLAVELAFGR